MELSDDTSAPNRSLLFRRAYDHHNSRVLAYCARRVGTADALDLASEVFAIAWRRIDDMPVGDAQLPWLYGVAYRVVTRHWRSQSRRSRLQNRVVGLRREAVPDTEFIVLRQHELQLIIDAAARLRAKDRELLRLTVWEELTHSEIAALLGLDAARRNSPELLIGIPHPGSVLNASRILLSVVVVVLVLGGF